MAENTETINIDEKSYQVLGKLSDRVQTNFSFFSFAKPESKPLKEENSSTQIDNRVIPNDIIDYVNWVGCVSNMSEDYFEVVAKSLVQKSTVRKFRIKKSYLKDDSEIQMDQIVRIKIKRYRQGNKPGIQIDRVVILDKPLNRSQEVIDDIVKRKMQRFAYMFDDEKR